MSTKNNPGKFDCYANAAPDEEMFILLARDPLSDPLTYIWAMIRAGNRAEARIAFEEMLHSAKSAVYVLNPDSEKAQEAVDVAARMYLWRKAHKEGGIEKTHRIPLLQHNILATLELNENNRVVTSKYTMEPLRAWLEINGERKEFPVELYTDLKSRGLLKELGASGGGGQPHTVYYTISEAGRTSLLTSSLRA